jgi:hypothetical protein
MGQVTKIVRGKYFDGCNSTDHAGYVAEKINDIVAAAASVEFLDTFRQGGRLVAVIVYTEA